MRSTRDSGETREQIRNAAIARFAADGLGASLRSIAADASVSAPLILHYFESRDGLLEACTEHVIAEATSSKSAILSALGGAEALVAQIDQVAGYASIVGYVIRLLEAGGERGNQLIDQLSHNAEGYIADAEAAGVVKPSMDPAARARYLTMQSLGCLMLSVKETDGTIDIERLPERLEQITAAVTLPLLEILTHGTLTDSSLLDAYVSRR